MIIIIIYLLKFWVSANTYFVTDLSLCICVLFVYLYNRADFQLPPRS
jgi:hypothetical protein